MLPTSRFCFLAEQLISITWSSLHTLSSSLYHLIIFDSLIAFLDTLIFVWEINLRTVELSSQLFAISIFFIFFSVARSVIEPVAPWSRMDEVPYPYCTTVDFQHQSEQVSWCVGPAAGLYTLYILNVAFPTSCAPPFTTKRNGARQGAHNLFYHFQAKLGTRHLNVVLIPKLYHSLVFRFGGQIAYIGRSLQ